MKPHRPYAGALALALICSVAMPVPAATLPPKGTVAAEDLFRIQLVSDTQIAPDGKRVAFVVGRLNGRANRYDTGIWLVPAGGGRPRALTTDGASSAPRWSPNGTTIAFTRVSKGVPQLFAYQLATKRTTQLTTLATGASGAVWSHDGKRIAFTSVAKDPPVPARIDFHAAGFTPTKAQRTSDVRTITDEQYEVNGLGYTYDLHAHLWVMNADGSHPVQLTSGRWSETGFAWSPDDATIAFTSLRRPTTKVGESDIYTISARGGALQTFASKDAANTVPTFANRSSRLFFFAGGVDDGAGYPALAESDADGANRHDIVPANSVMWGDALLADLKMPSGICGPLPAPDDRSVVVNVSAPGVTKLVRVDAQTGAMHDLTAEAGEMSDCTMSADGTRIAYAFADATHPAEVHVFDATTNVARAATALNAPYLASVQLSTPEPFTVTDPAGFPVQAWFMPAVGPKSGGRRPTVLEIHGGPETQYGLTFFHEAQFLAGHGYNVVISDPRGSVGFGYPFEEALVGHWGDPMFDDISAVMDAVVKRPDVDPARLGVSGGSYGGYAALWIIGHTDRFKVAIAERPASDLASQQLDAFFASSNGLGGEYAWGKPWDPASRNAADSPLTYVEHVHTPVLILHSTEDTETPLDQTLDEFSALKQLGRTVLFVEFPHENHDLNRVGTPIHRVERLAILRSWLDRYLQP